MKMPLTTKCYSYSMLSHELASDIFNFNIPFSCACTHIYLRAIRYRCIKLLQWKIGIYVPHTFPINEGQIKDIRVIFSNQTFTSLVIELELVSREGWECSAIQEFIDGEVG